MEKAMELLKPIAEQLGVTIEYLWETLVKQEYINAITYIILAIIFCIAIFIIVMVFQKLIKKEDDETRFLLIVLSIVLICSCLVFCIHHTISGIHRLINPDYFAFGQILNVIE